MAREISTIRFAATAEIGAGTHLALPEGASAKIPSRGETTVEGVIHGFPFRAALEPDGRGGRRLKTTEPMRDAAGAAGDGAPAVEITRLGAEPEIRVPTDLRKALKTDARARAAWAEITPTARRDWILWIATAKRSETRGQRIEKARDMLSSGKRRVCCFPGLRWLTKDRAAPDETWVPLTSPRRRGSPRRGFGGGARRRGSRRGSTGT